MKKISLFIIVVFGWYSSDAQSNIQKVAIPGQAAQNIGNVAVSQQQTVSSVQSASNYQAAGSNASAYTTSQQANINKYEPVSQSFSSGRKSGHYRLSVKSPARNFALNADYLVPAIKTTLVSAYYANSKASAEPKNFSSYYQFDTVNNSGILPEIQPITKWEPGVGIVTDRVHTSIAGINYKTHKYRCLSNNAFTNYGMNWYSIHLASFKNLDYCRAAIRYIKSRYKTEVFLFDDFSVYKRYHLVMGKYRKYFVAENMLRKIRKEMPGAFVVNWNSYYQLILFTRE
ncbi:MAG TPA: hypothetical protein PLT47_04725 [Bacteroidales bacterium]|nr:hypothetical protein [Bacteroidales bacterium]HQI70031.1 hypothetical protein [Bacteroidales bacterium]